MRVKFVSIKQCERNIAHCKKILADNSVNGMWHGVKRGLLAEITANENLIKKHVGKL